jgi:hypothetical protein
MRRFLTLSLISLALVACQTGGGGSNSYNSGYGNSNAECSSERDTLGNRYYLCNAPNGMNCASERSRDGHRYYKCVEGGSSGSSSSYDDPGCRSERDKNGHRYYMCKKPNGMNCSSERSNEGVRYYLCR